jgi:hypothetical protein
MQRRACFVITKWRELETDSLGHGIDICTGGDERFGNVVDFVALECNQPMQWRVAVTALNRGIGTYGEEKSDYVSMPRATGNQQWCFRFSASCIDTHWH